MPGGAGSHAAAAAAAAALARCASLVGPPLALQCVGAWARGSSGSQAQCSSNSANAAGEGPHVSPGQGFRLVQYNIRGFSANDGSSTLEALSATLRALQPSVVCLNEVDLRKQEDGVRRLAQEVGASHFHFFGHVGGVYGNALLSRFPILAARDVDLEGGTEVEWPPGSGNIRRIRRGLLAATLALPIDAGGTGGATDGCENPVRSPSQEVSAYPENRTLTVFCTHLDHMNAGQRLVQVSHALREMEATNGSPHLLVGDLNALFEPDYSPEEWGALQAKAAAQGWAPPSDDPALALLLSRGYADAFRLATAAGEHGPLPMDVPKFTAHIDRPMYRIDYALVSPGALTVGLRVTRAHVEVSAKGSDHFPLVVDFAWQPGGVPRPPFLGQTARL